MKDIKNIAECFNDGDPADVDYSIARYVLSHLDEVDRESMSTVAKDAAVSKSTLSRFVRRFGFDDYDDFLVAVREVTRADFPMILGMTPAQIGLISESPRGLLVDYVESICQALRQMAETVSLDDARNLIELLRTCRTVIIAQDEPLLVAREFQYQLLCEGVLAKVPGTEQKRLESMATVGEKSFVLVLSNYGNYVNSHEEELKAAKLRGATVWLVTLCHSAPNLFLFDRVVRLSPGGYSRAGSHPMWVYFEFLARLMHVGNSDAAERSDSAAPKTSSTH